ncbi:hypothetical protein [Rhodovulum sulfidophilum]|uniref:Uncharacterized protein n=1 Tax=Rhodovulum sulfidophilum TaxID=35806 RepID=A0ABS1S290_RHOSU|nr:hypothetical protein [Rhodovulum sulfidophilum]MBL3611289.1 hypothetical protein [Rhodovulum sulfidophilum]MCE8458091.1 hypothetical protein [Rhodovulum sulfidophilum]
MTQCFVDDAGVSWSYDQQAALRLIAHYARLRAMNETTRVVTSRDSLIQKLYLARELANVETDVNRMLARKTEIEEVEGRRFATLMLGAAGDAQAYLIGLRRETDRLMSANQSIYRSAQDINQAAIDHAETAIKVAKGVRDSSVLTLGVIATVATGGTTIAVASGAGAGLSATATYQDTGSASKAAIKGGLFLLPLGTRQITGAATAAGASPTMTAAMSLAIDTGAETFEGVYVNDATLERALSAALINQVSGRYVGALAKENTRWMGQRLRGAVRLLDNHGGQMSNRAYPFLSEMGGKLTQEAIKVSPGETPAGTSPGSGPGSAARAAQSQARDTASLWVMREVMRRL